LATLLKIFLQQKDFINFYLEIYQIIREKASICEKRRKANA